MSYKHGSLFRSKINQLGARSQKVEKSKMVVDFVTLYVSNNPSTHDTETTDLIKKVEQIRHELGADRPYRDRLDIWYKAKIFSCSRIWFGDTSRIYFKNGQLGYDGPKPQPDWIATIHPTNKSEILDCNLKNINSYIEQIGPFEQYEQQYIEHLKEHADSVLYERKLIMDLNAAEDAVSHSDIVGFFGVSTRDWYESFTNRNDTLNKKDYRIWDLSQSLPELPLLSADSSPSPPYLLSLLDDTDDIIKAATGYLLHLKIPFLRRLKDNLLEEALAYEVSGVPANDHEVYISPEDTVESVVGSDHTGTQTKTGTRKKSKKKEQQLTTKQQMILLNALGFLNASIIGNLTNQHKATILAQLLNRSKQEIRSMLTYWQGVNAPKDYDCSQPDDIEIVYDLLSDNNLGM